MSASLSESELNFQGPLTTVASIAVLLYDILLTFDREVTCIWKRKTSAVTFIYLYLRYATLAFQIPHLVNSIQPGNPIGCKVTGYLADALCVSLLFTAAVFISLRMFAIWGRRWLVLVVILPISLVPAVSNAYLFSFMRLSPLATTPGSPLHGCNWVPLLSAGVVSRLSTGTRICAIAGDAIVLVATWLKTWSIRRGLKALDVNGEQSKVSLTGLLVRDGTLYFATLLFFNVLVLVVSNTPEVQFSPSGAFIDAFTGLLLCRFILNLRSFDFIDEFHPTSTSRQFTSVRFAHGPGVLDNIGASVIVDDYTDSAESFQLGSQAAATFSEVVNNPLAIGLEAHMCGTESKSPESEKGMGLVNDSALFAYPKYAV